MVSDREHLGEPHVMEHVLQDIKDIKETVHWLVQSKQDKVRPSIFIPFVVYLISQAFVGVWWASDITASINSLVDKIETVGTDNFYNRDADNLRGYIDLRIEKIDLRDSVTEEKLKHINEKQTEIELRLRDLEKKQ